MNLFSIIPLVGAAVAPTISSVVDSATESLSFLDILHEAPREDETDKVQEDASTTLDRDFAELAERLRERFAQIGIDLTTPIRLKQSGRDRVVVDGDHPDRVLIESVFTNNEDLANLFSAVAESATKHREASDSGLTREFRLVLGRSDATIEFD